MVFRREIFRSIAKGQRVRFIVLHMEESSGSIGGFVVHSCYLFSLGGNKDILNHHRQTRNLYLSFFLGRSWF